MESKLTVPENYEEICNNISDMISTTRKGVFQAVNTSHVMLNWNIGKN